MQNAAIEIENNKFLDENTAWLVFNDRVRREAHRPYPIGESFSFLGFSESNILEFIQTKMNTRKDIKSVRKQISDIEDTYRRTVARAADNGIEIIDNISKLSQGELEHCKRMFEKNIQPILQPLVLRDELPLPNIYDSGTFLLTTMDDGISVITRLPEPELVKIKGSKKKYIISSVLIKAFSPLLFPGKKMKQNNIIRILRKIDSLRMVDPDNSYVDELEKQLYDRRKARIVVVEIEEKSKILNPVIPKNCRKIVRQYPYGFSFCKDIEKLIGSSFGKLKSKNPFPKEQSIFKTLNDRDVLVHFPYQSFAKSTLRFVEEAAIDPNVVVIKQTLYRVSKHSKMTEALMKAARSGKHVTVLLELKAKLDEMNNINLVRELADAGCNIIYGPLAIKTHGKVCLVIRKEGNGLGKYINISTGNFNEKTSKSYEDLSYFMKDRKGKITKDLSNLFNHLGGYSKLEMPEKLLIAPNNFRSSIEAEMDVFNSSPVAKRMSIKCNALTDERIAGKILDIVKTETESKSEVDLLIRGANIIDPLAINKDELTREFKMMRCVGRFLEHSRIYAFEYEDHSKIFIGSGDLMPRNLDRRVEIIMPVEDESIKRRLLNILAIYKNDSNLELPLNVETVYPVKDVNLNSSEDELVKGGLCSRFTDYYKSL